MMPTIIPLSGFFSKMLEDIEVRSFAGRRQRELLDELSRIFLLSYIEGRAMGSIVNTDLKDAYHDVKNSVASIVATDLI